MKDKGSLTTWKEKSTFRAKALRRELVVSRNVDFSFIVSGSERTFTFRVSLKTLYPTGNVSSAYMKSVNNG